MNFFTSFYLLHLSLSLLPFLRATKAYLHAMQNTKSLNSTICAKPSELGGTFCSVFCGCCRFKSSNLGLVNAYCTLCQFFSTPQYECTVNVPYLMPYEKLDPASMRCDYSDVRTVQTCIRAFISSYAVSFGCHKSPDRLHCNAAPRSTGFHFVDALVFRCPVCTVRLLRQLVHSLYSCIWCQC